MRNQRMRAIFVSTCVILFMLASYMVATAQDGGGQSDPGKQAPGVIDQAATGNSTAPGGGQATDLNVVQKSGTLDSLNGGGIIPQGGGGIPLLYQFSGVADDGLKGIGGRKATAITCSNTSDTPITVLEVVYGPNGATFYSVQFSLPAWTTYTASTQPTAMYAAPNYLYLFRASLAVNGTEAISQGMGRIYSASPNVICTAQVLDPSGNPPAYMAELELFR